MSSGWFLAVSALIFAIGSVGVVTRRNPLLTLVSLELMLNAGNLALITFARMHGATEGHVFALVVLVVAAAEVAVGLGLVVALYRNRVAVDVDELREMRG
jgi:NADH-quinone oxidoreductase subunit K